MQNTTTTTRKTNKTNRKYKVCKENCSCDLYNNSLYVVNDADGACLSPTGKATFWKPELYSVVLEFELLRNLITTLILIWASLTSDYELSSLHLTSSSLHFQSVVESWQIPHLMLEYLRFRNTQSKRMNTNFWYKAIFFSKPGIMWLHIFWQFF